MTNIFNSKYTKKVGAASETSSILGGFERNKIV